MIIPPQILPGQRVAVVSTAFSARQDAILLGCEVLKSWEWEVATGISAFNSFGCLAGTDNQRLIDLQSAIHTEGIRAIICTRGGYGTNRLLPNTDWKSMQANPFWVVGFSDITAIHLHLQTMGIASVHGPMAVHLGRAEHAEAVGILQNILSGQISGLRYGIELFHMPENHIQLGGDLTGGNLTLVTNSLGTFSEIDTQNRILFLEEVGESGYKTDRMLNHLYRAGKLAGVRAVVLGYFTDCDQGEFPLSVPESVVDITAGKIPVFVGLKSGHEAPNFPLVMGAETRLVQEEGKWIFVQDWNTLPPISSLS